jgi:uncharacterized protein YwgA
MNSKAKCYNKFVISTLSNKDWMLLVLFYAGSVGLSPVKLQKSLFLLQKAFHQEIGNFYAFKPYNYGPFDARIYVNADELVTDGLVSKVTMDHSWSTYVITKPGLVKAKTLLKVTDKKIIKYIKQLIRWMQPLSFEVLISSVYKKYPEYKKNSVFID